jgi:RHS repeat-associated protein
MCAARVFLSGLIVSAVLATGISLPANAVMAVPDTALVSPAAASPALAAQAGPEAASSGAAADPTALPEKPGHLDEHSQGQGAGDPVPGMPASLVFAAGTSSAANFSTSSSSGAGGGAHRGSSVPGRMPLLNPAWTVSLAVAVGTTLTLTATVNQPLDGTGQWLEIFDTTSTGNINYLKYCNTGTTCVVGTVPSESQSTYIAVVGNTLSNTYAGYPSSSASAWSNQVTPPAWTLALSANISSTIGLTATTNYAATGSTWIEIFDTTSTRNITYLNYCNAGTTCSVTTVPAELNASYTAVVTHSLTNTYPPPNVLATSNAITPAPWIITLASNGSSLTATTNYDTSNSGLFVEIFDQSRQGHTTSYVGWCTTGTSCTKTTSYSGHTFIATVGGTSNNFAPSPLLAVSNQAGTAGPTSAYETAGGSNPAELNQCFACKGDPVNTSNGEFFENDTDISVAGRGPGLVLGRAYSSQRAPFDGPLGYGWSFNYNMSLAVKPSGSADVHQENGSMVTFTPDANGAYHAPARVLAVLAHNADGTWTYTRRANEVFAFTSTGQLSVLSDLNGNTTTLARNGAGQLTTATDGAGRTLTFTYDAAGRIATVTDPAGRVVSYQYDSTGRLTSVTVPGGAVTGYGYDSANLVTTIVDPRGHTTTNVYDTAHRVTKQTDRAGGITTLSYGTDGTTTTVSPAGRTTAETYSNGQLIKTVEGAGTAQAATWTYAYDQNTFGTTTVTDPLNHTSTATYDAAGNKLTATDPANHQRSWTYNSLNNVTSATDAAGITSSYTYDAAGNPLTVSTPLTGTSQSATVSYAHNDQAHPGDVTAITDPVGSTTALTYTAYGAVASSADPLGNTASFTYDILGRRLTLLSPRGNTTGYGYDTAGHLSAVTDPLNHTTGYVYDADGNRTAATDALGHTTNTAYDALNRQVTVTNPDSTAATTAYDPDGNRTSQTDPGSHTTTYTYDPLNRLTTSTDPLARVTLYAYDAAGHPITLTDSAGRITTNTYDTAGNKTGTSYSDGTTPNAAFSYTVNGQRATMTDGTGTTTNTYDSLGRLTAVTNGAGQATGYSYDLAGHLTALAYPNAQTVTRAYDTAGRLTGITDWLSHTTTFTPDADSNTASTAYGNGVTAAAVIDADGRITAVTDTGPGNTALASFSYARNDAGSLASATTTGITQPAETYTYTSRDQLAAVNAGAYAYDPAGNATALASGATMAYDAASQPTSYTAAGTTTPITYDAQGNRLTGPAPGGATAAYTWDQANRLTAANGTTYAYNADNLRTTRTPATGTAQHYAWDTRAGVPLMLTDGTASYLYDDNGNPVEQIAAAGTALFYQHDQYGSTRLLTDTTGAVAATYSYDANGNLTNHTGTADTPLRWNGQCQDSDTGLYYLRARYYDPQTAQFTGVDPLAAITQAIYNYANNNPLNLQDPLGLWSWNPMEWTGQEWATVGAVAGTVALAAAVVGATVLTGGVAGALVVGIGYAAGAVSTSISVVAAVNDCSSGFSENCAYSAASAGLGLAGFRFGRFMSKTAWTSLHVNEADRAAARVAWGAANFSGPVFDGVNYVRNYC